MDPRRNITTIKNVLILGIGDKQGLQVLILIAITSVVYYNVHYFVDFKRNDNSFYSKNDF